MVSDKRRFAAVVLTLVVLVGGLGLGTLQAQDDNTPININTADEATLMLLKGIGEVKAKAIVEYRQSQPFETIADLMKVPGIGEKTFESIKDHITAGEPAEE